MKHVNHMAQAAGHVVFFILFVNMGLNSLILSSNHSYSQKGVHSRQITALYKDRDRLPFSFLVWTFRTTHCNISIESHLFRWEDESPPLWKLSHY